MTVSPAITQGPSAPAAQAVLAAAEELAAAGGRVDAADAERVFDAAGGDRSVVEEVRNLVAARLHASVDDFQATALLQVLNRVLSSAPRPDPLDWRVRWTQRFRRP